MIISQITNGFGNNLFQCVAGKLLADYHNTAHYFLPEVNDYECSVYLTKLGFKIFNKNSLESPIIVNDQHYPLLFEERFKGKNIILKGYFENKDFYEKHRSGLIEWFPKVQKNNCEDLVFHFRTGDRLFYKNEFSSKPSPKQIKKAIDSFNFKRLHIVTDMPEWKKHDVESLSKLKFHVKVKKESAVDANQAVAYFNECFAELAEYDPIVVKRNVLQDFDFIRSFDKILFQHGTMSWWASFLSDASRIGVYGPWRPWKGNSNKNLSEVSLNTWFKWE